MRDVSDRNRVTKSLPTGHQGTKAPGHQGTGHKGLDVTSLLLTKVDHTRQLL